MWRGVLLARSTPLHTSPPRTLAAMIGGGQSIVYALMFYQAGAAVFFLPLAYLMILFGIGGVPLYFSGLKLFAFGFLVSIPKFTHHHLNNRMGLRA